MFDSLVWSRGPSTKLGVRRKRCIRLSLWKKKKNLTELMTMKFEYVK